MGCLESWALKYIVRYTSDTVQDRHSMILCGCGLPSLFVAVDIDNQDIGAGDVFSLPNQTIRFNRYTPDKTYFSKSFPLVLNFNWLTCPLFADYFRDLGVGEAWVKGNDLGLIMLPIKNESCIYESIRSSKQRRNICLKENGGSCNQLATVS
jgi:hypothetical protein